MRVVPRVMYIYPSRNSNIPRRVFWCARQGTNLAFTFLKNGGEWKVKPTNEKKEKLYQELCEYLKRGKAIARPLAVIVKRVNQIVMDWINYFRVGIKIVELYTRPVHTVQ